MGGLRGLGRLGGLRRVGVRAAQAEMWDEWDRWDEWEGEQKGRLLDVCSLLVVRLSFANCSLIVRSSFA